LNLTEMNEEEIVLVCERIRMATISASLG